MIKKGLQWEVVQDKNKDVDQEVAMFLMQEDMRNYSTSCKYQLNFVIAISGHTKQNGTASLIYILE